MSSPVLVSVGYEGRTSEQLVEALVAAGVCVLVDVRLTPISRKPGLSKTRLGAHLADAGIGYVHLRALGNPKENRAPFWSGDLRTGLRCYLELLATTGAQAALGQIEGLLTRGAGPVAVLCFEADHDRCHRQAVVEELRDRVPALHLIQG